MDKTGGISLPRIVFDGIWAIMDAMKLALKFQKKTRIVVDYDPQREKWSISFYQTTEEPDNSEEDQPGR